MWLGSGKQGTHTEFLWENLLENLYLEDGKDNIKMDIRYIDCEVDETG